MARSFIYDNVGFSEATLQAGYYDQTDDSYAFTASSAEFPNPSVLADQNTSIVLGLTGGAEQGWEQYEVLQVDLGSAKSPDTIATYHKTIAENNQLLIYASDSATSWVTGDYIATTSGTLPIDTWTVASMPVTNKRYIYMYNGTADNYQNISEMIIGTKYDFAVNPELNAKTGEEFGTDIITSYGGNEYANKRHAPKTTWDWNWSHILSTQKTALEDLNASVQDWKKFIYDDETTKHYVRMTKPVSFTEVAPNVYSANMSLREQLS